MKIWDILEIVKFLKIVSSGIQFWKPWLLGTKSLNSNISHTCATPGLRNYQNKIAVNVQLGKVCFYTGWSSARGRRGNIAVIS